MDIPCTVFILRHTHDRLGETITAHANRVAARAELHTIAVNGWTELHCLDGTSCAVESCAGVPSDPFDLSRDDAIDTYFTHRADTESYRITDREVEIPARVVFAAWGQRVREAASRSGDAVMTSGHQRAAARQESQP